MKGKGYNYFGTLYFSKSPNIDPLDPKTYTVTSFQIAELSQTDYFTGTVSFGISKNALIQDGFKHGETIYCASFFGNDQILNNYYYDPLTQSKVYTGFSSHHSQVKSFILP